MDLYEATTHSFVLKIWLEEAASNAGPLRWRGHITHVSDGKRRYLQNLIDLDTFILSYLQHMGIPISWPWRITLRLSASRRRRLH